MAHSRSRGGDGGAGRADDCRHAIARAGPGCRPRDVGSVGVCRSGAHRPNRLESEGRGCQRIGGFCHGANGAAVDHLGRRGSIDGQAGIRDLCATLAQLVLEVPANQKIVNVYDRNVQRWKPESVEGVQRVLVDLFEPIQGKQTLVVELEEFSDATESSYDVTAAVVTAVGVGRQQGIVVARLESGLQGEATKRVGLMQLDQGDLPQELQGGKWDFAYRYGAVPYELQVRVEKVLPRISVTELIDVDLSSDQLLMTWQGVYTIEEAGVFQLQLDLPDGFEVRSIHGVTVGDAQAVAVDAHHRVAADRPTWRVNLSKKAFGKVALAAQLRRALDDPNLPRRRTRPPRSRSRCHGPRRRTWSSRRARSS